MHNYSLMDWIFAVEALICRRKYVHVRALLKRFWRHHLSLRIQDKTRQSKQCGFSIYIFDNSNSKSMVRLVRSEKMALSGLVFARKIARMILIQNI